MEEIIAQVTSSIDALMREFNIITHNLANVNTAGYKRICNAFSKALEAQKAGEETYSPGIIDLNSALDFSQGGITKTGRPLDIALHGKGLFVIETPEGPLYTRHGIFYINQNSQIVDVEGRIVAGEAGPITIPTDVSLSQLNVSSDGNISAGDAVIDKFRLVDFADNQNKLEPVGKNCLRMTEEGVEPVTVEHIVVKQGYLESSNVKMVDELVDMIMVSRLYQANIKFVTAKMETTSSLISVAMG